MHPLIRVLPYQVSPNLTERPMRRRAYIMMKYGSLPAGARAVEEAEEELRRVGIEP